MFAGKTSTGHFQLLTVVGNHFPQYVMHRMHGGIGFTKGSSIKDVCLG